MNRFVRVTHFTRVVAAAVAASLSLFSGGATAQNFTGKTVRIIVPFAPGGTSDILARALADKLGEGLGATVVVDNKPGANGILAFKVAFKGSRI
jgi:tripartite-type tricarboxylate transporter receptor subunit TctC